MLIYTPVTNFSDILQVPSEKKNVRAGEPTKHVLISCNERIKMEKLKSVTLKLK
jgi:hypothetical protein